MSSTGYPDFQRITQWFGAPLDQATAYAIGAGAKVVGPLQVASFASIVVCVRPVGGSVTVTVEQQVPGGPPGLKTSTSFVAAAGNSVFEAFVLLAGAATVTFQGSAGGETLDYAIVPSNTNTNAEVAALTQLGFQLNDVLVANETAVDFLDTTTLLWTLVNDPANLRMKASAMHRAVAAKVIRQSAQAYASGAFTAISFDAAYIDTDTMWAAGSPTRLTCKVAGTYLVGGTIGWAPSAGGSYRHARIVLDGATNIDLAQLPPMGANTVYPKCAGMTHMDVGDYIELFGQQDSGGALNSQFDPQDTPTLWATRV